MLDVCKRFLYSGFILGPCPKTHHTFASCAWPQGFLSASLPGRSANNPRTSVFGRPPAKHLVPKYWLIWPEYLAFPSSSCLANRPPAKDEATRRANSVEHSTRFQSFHADSSKKSSMWLRPSLRRDKADVVKPFPNGFCERKTDGRSLPPEGAGSSVPAGTTKLHK